MGRRRRYHVYKLAKLRNEEAALKSNEEPVKVSSSDLNTKPIVEPTLEPKIDLKAENEAPVEVKKKEAPKKKTTRKRTTTKKPTTIGTKSTTRRRRTTKKKVEETKNEKS
mgnify:CR=1 FL=1|jgi:hypothetical protein|tara:strand:+ start:96 stop:425 length:330 start_codon:yes stop_codon:yes gene_type:complete